MNCQHGELIEGTWPLCRLHGQKMTFMKCENCPRHLPYVEGYPAVSLVMINVYGMTKQDWKMRQNGAIREDAE